MTRKNKLVLSLSEAGAKRRQRSGNKKTVTLLFIATLALAGFAHAGFDIAATRSNYVAAVDKQAFLGTLPQDDPVAAMFVNERRGQLALIDKDYQSAVGFFQGSLDAGEEGVLPRLIMCTRLSGDVEGALAFEDQVPSIKLNKTRARSYYELAQCQSTDQINAYLLKAARSGRIPGQPGNIWFMNRMLNAYRFVDATPQEALAFLDAVDLMLEDTAKTAAITGKIIDMKNEQKRREQ